MTTGQLIKAARKNAGMTQKELGEKLGVAYQTLAQWENDLRNPKYATLMRIADALGIEWAELEPSVKGNAKERRKGYIALAMHELIATQNPLSRIIAVAEQMNDEGQTKVADYAEDILPRYRRPDAVPPSPADRDTPTGEKPAEGN